MTNKSPQHLYGTGQPVDIIITSGTLAIHVLPNKQETQPAVATPKLVTMTHWQALCVDLIGSNTLKGKDDSSIEFMASL
jgi:hypothetical protein